MSTRTAEVLDEVHAERARQDARFGEQNHPNGTGSPTQRFEARQAQAEYEGAKTAGCLTFAHVLDEEFKEALAESDPMRLRAELIQVAAVAVCWIEALDRAEENRRRWRIRGAR